MGNCRNRTKSANMEINRNIRIQVTMKNRKYRLYMWKVSINVW